MGGQVTRRPHGLYTVELGVQHAVDPSIPTLHHAPSRSLWLVPSSVTAMLPITVLITLMCLCNSHHTHSM